MSGLWNEGKTVGVVCKQLEFWEGWMSPEGRVERVSMGPRAEIGGRKGSLGLCPANERVVLDIGRHKCGYMRLLHLCTSYKK